MITYLCQCKWMIVIVKRFVLCCAELVCAKNVSGWSTDRRAMSEIQTARAWPRAAQHNQSRFKTQWLPQLCSSRPVYERTFLQLCSCYNILFEQNSNKQSHSLFYLYIILWIKKTDKKLINTIFFINHWSVLQFKNIIVNY